MSEDAGSLILIFICAICVGLVAALCAAVLSDHAMWWVGVTRTDIRVLVATAASLLCLGAAATITGRALDRMRRP